jgi:hypothetical protein
MKVVGFHYNRSPLDEKRRLRPSIVNRIVLIDGFLREAGLRLFVYAPHHIKPTEDTVEGYLFEDGNFLPSTTTIPTVNGNWTHRTRRLLEEGMGYQQFGKWAEERRIGIYVPHAFSELLGNKHETYKLVRGFHETLHPHSELYARSERQLAYFVETGRITFLKPRTGSKGDRIITLRRDETGLSVTYYEAGERKLHAARTLADASKLVRGLIARGQSYVIQHGVETMRHGLSTFDIRVTMLHDGRAWHWLHEVRLSREGSDVSNVRQGGEILATEDLLLELVGSEGAQQLLYELKSESFGLAAYLERLHPGDILEVAFDFVIDREGRLRLLEINTKPGLAGVGSDISVFDKRPENEPLFERWVYPHTRHLARFLMSKVERRAP